MDKIVASSTLPLLQKMQLINLLTLFDVKEINWAEVRDEIFELAVLDPKILLCSKSTRVLYVRPNKKRKLMWSKRNWPF